MPNIVTGDLYSNSSVPSQLRGKEINYDYPDGLDLRPTSKLHQKLKNAILQRARASYNVISNRYDSWRNIDQTLTAYIPLSEAETTLKKKDSRKPVSIIFPYTYAVLETLLTYMTMAFLQDPIIRYEGKNSEDTIGAMLLEQVVGHHCYRNKVGLGIHTMLRDSIAYGIGVAAPYWHVQYGMKPTLKSSFSFGEGMEIIENAPERVVEEGILFEGNALANVDPYTYLPDPGVASHRLQDGEFYGWYDRTNYMQLLREEKNNPEMFNVRYLSMLQRKTSTIFTGDESDRNQNTKVDKIQARQLTENVTNPVDVIKMTIDLIPNEWGLGDDDYPETWYFELAGDEVIIQARRLELWHGMKPIVSASPDFDGYSPVPMSRLEVLYGLQGVLDFLFNSHIANVRKAINDMLIVDPYLINIKDLQSPKPGKLIRMRRPAWGRGVENAVKQLGIVDITKGNIDSSSWVVQWMNKISAVDDSMMGAMRQGGPERLTKSEFQGTRTSGVSRLERVARVVGMQAFLDMGIMFASHTQQSMEESDYVKITGRYQQELMQFYGVDPNSRVPVSPDELMVNYDVQVRDGSVPGGNFSDQWINMFQNISQDPELRQTFDIVRIFKYISQQMGAKNVNDFVRQGGSIDPTTVSDEDVLEQARRGNVVPIGALG